MTCEGCRHLRVKVTLTGKRSPRCAGLVTPPAALLERFPEPPAWCPRREENV